jgi:hypothetical protein
VAVSIGRLDRGISKALSTAVPIDPAEDGAEDRSISVIGILTIEDISLAISGASLGIKAALMAPTYGVGSGTEATIRTGSSVDVRVGVLAANGTGADSITGKAPAVGALGGGDGSVDAVALYTGGLYEKGYTWGANTGLNSGWRSPLC